LLFFNKIIIAGEDIGLQPHFQKFSHKIVLLRNFPVILLSEKDVFPKPQDKINFIYTGGLSEDRGILEFIQAFREVRGANAELLLLGSFTSNDFKKRVMDEIEECDNIRYIPSVSYKEMFAILAKCHVGLICFKPTPNNIGALSGRNNKIYEYMQAGLAVIGSNFPFWKDFIERNGIGVTVDPNNIYQIKEAMEFLVSNPEKLAEMQRNAKLLSYEYSWDKEGEKLLRLYEELLR
jgi:glycosyltransferase involved in cell wall biosynthesis